MCALAHLARHSCSLALPAPPPAPALELTILRLPPHHIRESGFGECAHGFLHAMHRSRSCSESGAAAHVGAGIMDVAHGPSRDW